MKNEMNQIVEKYMSELVVKFHAKVVEQYGEDYPEEVAELNVEDVDKVDMMEEMLSYLVSNMDDVFDEIDQDGMVGEFIFNS